jgi:hypothetical protein
VADWFDCTVGKPWSVSWLDSPETNYSVLYCIVSAEICFWNVTGPTTRVMFYWYHETEENGCFL